MAVQSYEWALTELVKLQQRQPDLVQSALEKTLRENGDLQWSLVVNAYLDEIINLGRAAELLGMHRLELQERFIELGIPLRIGAATLEEARAEVAAIRKWKSVKESKSRKYNARRRQ
ncbi:MAG: UPF0175 family protein [Chloroflexi bacterium]|nr:UPF0175 family protein [Chloroflexota bacterium]